MKKTEDHRILCKNRILRSTWCNMITRCYNSNALTYYNYGAKGISVCDSWRNSFEQFKADMGYRPSKDYSLDRINPYGDYEPSNCRWADIKTQSTNKRTEKIDRIGDENDTERLSIYKKLFKKHTKIPFKKRSTVGARVTAEVRAQLEAMAAQEKRSLSGQIEFLLEKAIAPSAEV